MKVLISNTHTHTHTHTPTQTTHTHTSAASRCSLSKVALAKGSLTTRTHMCKQLIAHHYHQLIIRNRHHFCLPLVSDKSSKMISKTTQNASADLGNDGLGTILAASSHGRLKICSKSLGRLRRRQQKIWLSDLNYASAVREPVESFMRYNYVEDPHRDHATTELRLAALPISHWTANVSLKITQPCKNHSL